MVNTQNVALITKYTGNSQMQEKKLTRSKKVIDALRKHYGDLKVGEFAAMLGIGASTVSTWANRDSLDMDLVFRKCKGVSYSFLETAEGEMFVTGEQPTTIAEQIGPGYGPEVKLAADYIQMRIEGKTRAERLEIIDQIMADIRERFK